MTENLVAQHNAIREGCGLWLGSDRAALVLTGQDRVRLLNGLVTCEVIDLEPGQGVRGFFTDMKGHILADVVVRSMEQSLRLDLPASEISSIAVHIEKYIVVDRVELEPLDEIRSLTLVGPRAGVVLEPVLDRLQATVSPWNHLQAGFQEQEVLVTADCHMGVPALTLWAPPPTIAEVCRVLVATESSEMPLEVSDEAIEVVRVEEGAPRFRLDYGSANLPQETGLENVVSYSKGCYLGQEVVARLHYRGQVARRLCRLQATEDELPAAGSRLVLDGREVGAVTSAVASPTTHGIAALAMLGRRALEPGTELQLADGGSMQVV
jgi:folate-binding protein YgfZ